jgi:hypothetical protein
MTTDTLTKVLEKTKHIRYTTDLLIEWMPKSHGCRNSQSSVPQALKVDQERNNIIMTW